MSSPSPSSSSPLSASRGQIHVKLISARALNVRSVHARPYVVVQFEQNEFVSRDPTEETDKEVKGVATSTLSRTSSSAALSSLDAINNRALNGLNGGGASARGSAQPSPSSSLGSGKSQLGEMFGGRISAHNPVWKHEVSL